MAHATSHETIKRQAKRLRDQFDIDLTTAKKVLARGPYGCSGWPDLCARLKQGPFEQGPLQLAELPKSPSAAAYLAKNLNRLASSISQQILTNRNLPALCEALRQVFAVPGNPVTLADVLQTVTHSDWEPADIGPDPHAVIQSRICVNGVELVLIGTRIFWPRLFEFDAAVEEEARTAEPLGDDLKIMWDVAAWYETARNYLVEYQRGDDWDDLPEWVEPVISENPRTQLHARWFAQCLTLWRQERRYNDEGEEFIPYLYQGNAYLVFGVPSPAAVTRRLLKQQSILFPGEGSNESQVILLDGQLLHVEMLAVPSSASEDGWDYAAYHQTLCSGLLGGAADAGWVKAPRGGWGNVLFMSPACQIGLERQLKVEIKPEAGETLFTLQTDNPELAVAVLERAVKGQVIRYDHEVFGARYAMRFDLPPGKESADLSLSLDFIEPTVIQSTHLIHRRITHTDSQGQTLYCEIDPTLLRLIERQPLKVLKKAIREGQVVRAYGLREQLEESSVRESQAMTLETADGWVSNPLEETAFSSDAIVEMGTIRYKRDNF